ncbi:hypothetical protein FRAAL3603 [Frankia alni ACN14a]|uniref:Uncharacterized protein n=1 Tax=Frankia alni (strain DSM 45986 / CECT 9034 / ACN14a) TaxID=326424 RepID=Q0RJR5_FRAAA|nr:hypothetical protein FRAAL3603 [Frankia alni ACN14a]
MDGGRRAGRGRVRRAGDRAKDAHMGLTADHLLRTAVLTILRLSPAPSGPIPAGDERRRGLAAPAGGQRPTTPTTPWWFIRWSYASNTDSPCESDRAGTRACRKKGPPVAGRSTRSTVYPGSQILDRGFRFTAFGSRFSGHSFRVTACGSQLAVHTAWIRVFESRFRIVLRRRRHVRQGPGCRQDAGYTARVAPRRGMPGWWRWRL